MAKKESGLVERAEAFSAENWDTVDKISNSGVKDAMKTMEDTMRTPT